MRLSRRTKAVIWGLSAGILFTGGWFWLSHSGEQGEPMLMPGQDRSIIVFENLKTGAWIFLCTCVPVALLVAFRPSSSDEHHDA
jgi:hypothetical protein